MWTGKKIKFNVRWSLGDTTWEPLENCNELAAFDEYLKIMNALDWMELHKKLDNQLSSKTTKQLTRKQSSRRR
jgi:hypothetical protein